LGCWAWIRRKAQDRRKSNFLFNSFNYVSLSEHEENLVTDWHGSV